MNYNEKKDPKLQMMPSTASGQAKRKELEARGNWGSKAEYILTVMGAIIGPGNVWRFPYLCYKNGGDSCMDDSKQNRSTNLTSRQNTTLPVMEFWERRVLNISGGIEEMGNIRWELALCLLFTWVICYFCVWKGMKSTGKAAYFTATFPYAMLLVLLVRGVTLPGAIDGIIFYIYPDISRLTDPQVWMDAGTQIFFSYAISLGFLTSLGSYNSYNNDCYKDCFYLCLLNSGTSIVSGFAIFSVLGFMTYEQGVSIEEVAESGPGLAFIVYPRAVAMMPMSQIWSACFFIMIILLGLDSQFVGLECLMTSVVDLFPTYLRHEFRRELLLLAICTIGFILGLALVTEGGMYLLQLLDHHVCSGTTLLLLAICQSVCIAWVYGAERFYGNISDMIGYRPLPLMKYCWLYITPTVCTATFIFSIVKYSPLKFSNTYVYPVWANTIGWFIATISLSFIPLWMVYKMANSNGTLRQVSSSQYISTSLDRLVLSSLG
uniref:Uncharacterized protein n=1 Tax=Oncorhynchus kisutch TaxID=8019 RepID=A0A8C7L3U7_ONCKI